MGLEAGAILARSYRLLHTIGEGGMGRVWVAEHIALERKVAVKVLSDEAILSRAALELFHREARATARVDSPHVVRVLDYDVTDQGWPFLVLELLVGETLEDRVRRSGAMPLDDVRALVTQTCDALRAAHECGILHRDIKAENLFLQRSLGQAVDVKLLDFGIALFKTGDGARQSYPVGTPQYMSPEQMLGADLDERTDLFSAGVCAYYALTGGFPYVGETLGEIGCSLSRGTFVPPTMARSGVPPALDDWFQRALAVRAPERFESAEEMRQAFDNALDPDVSNVPLPTASASSVPVALDVPSRYDGWPRAVWKGIGAVAALACVLVAVRSDRDHRSRHEGAGPISVLAGPRELPLPPIDEPPTPPAPVAVVARAIPRVEDAPAVDAGVDGR
jgi:serine/threonine protein kinase